MTDNNRTIAVVAGGIALLALLLYLPTMDYQFLEWDDGTYVVDNQFLRSFDGAFLKWAFFSFHAANWHPLTWISHAADLAIWGTNPSGHHLTNVLFHAFNTFLVVMLVARLVTVWRERNGSSEPADDRGVIVAAGVTGLLFAVHPIHVESVAWVAERKDVLCGFFFLLTLLIYLHDRYRKLSLPLFVMALLSKPMAVSLPVVLLLLDWYPLGRLGRGREAGKAILEKIPFFLLGIGSAVVTFLAQRAGGAVSTVESVPFYARAAVAFRAVSLYLWKSFIPTGLSPFYPYPSGKELFALPSFVLMAITVAMAVVSFRLRKRTPLFAALFGYALVTLLPVLGLVQIGRQSMADRYMYLPGLAPLLLIAVVAFWLIRKGWGAGKVVAGASVIAVLFTVATLRQMPVWHDGITLWTSVLDRGGDRLDFAFNNRGVAWDRQGDLKRAEEDLNKAIAINRHDPDYLSNRGTIFLKLNRPKEALEDFMTAMAIDPTLPGPYYNTACILSLRNDTDGACYWLGRSIAHGYNRWSHINSDPDLTNLRTTPCYRTLMDKVAAAAR